MPEVSVIIPTYNSARFLAESIQSVLHQTFTDFELLVIDDGSTDDTRQVVAQFEGDLRASYFHQENRGGAAARNTGIKHSSGRFVAFLDADDLWFPGKLQSQVAVLRENSEVSVVHTALVLLQIDNQDREVSRRIHRRPTFRERTLYEELLYEMVITGSASSVIVRRDALDQVGPFDELIRISDYDMWQRLAEHHNFYYLDESLVCIRKHLANMSNDLEMMVENHLRYFQKLSREIPPQYRDHLPRIAIIRFTKMTMALLRRGKLRVACAAGRLALSHACRCPGAVFHVAARLCLGLGSPLR